MNTVFFRDSSRITRENPLWIIYEVRLAPVRSHTAINKFLYRKTCISLFLRAIINVFIQVIFPNVITYLDYFKRDKMIQNSK